MKKIKLFLLSIIGIVVLTGCDLFKMDTMEGINIVTTSYPLEYILKRSFILVSISFTLNLLPVILILYKILLINSLLVEKLFLFSFNLL